MSRSDYSDSLDQWAQICWNGAVQQAIRGKRGQVLLRDLLGALDAMPDKRLIADEFATTEGAVCALGALGVARGMPLADLAAIDGEDEDTPKRLGRMFNIAPALVREIEYQNDSDGHREPSEKRWRSVRAWVASEIRSR